MGGKITFVGDASGPQLAQGIVESIRELSTEGHTDGQLGKVLDLWLEERAEKLALIGMREKNDRYGVSNI